MSYTSEALPQARSGIGIGTIVRLLAIALGIMSATAMAVNGFEVPVNQGLMDVLEGVRELVGTIVWPFEKLIVMPVVNWLHAQGARFDLYAHWKTAFVLLWLYFAAFSRAAVATGYSLGRTVYVWLLSGVCALAGGVLAGTAPLSHPAVFWWPASALLFSDIALRAMNAARGSGDLRITWLTYFAPVALAYFAVAAFCALMAASVRTLPLASEPSVFWWPFLALQLIYVAEQAAYWGRINWPSGLVAAVFVLLAVQAAPKVNLLVETSNSPGLATLVLVISISAGLVILWTVANPDGKGDTYQQKILNSAGTRMGIDILAVLAGTVFTVWLGHTLA